MGALLSPPVGPGAAPSENISISTAKSVHVHPKRSAKTTMTSCQFGPGGAANFTNWFQF